MADPLRITVGSSTADENPYASFEASSYYDPVELNPRSRDLVIRTIFGEAGDKDEAGRAAVANVIRNRVSSGRSQLYGEGVEGVIGKKHAFEPWSRPDARQRMLDLREDDPHYQSIAKIADDIFKGVVQDPTGGATHFYSPSAQAHLARTDRRKLVPDWARGQPLANIGGHLFYAPEGAVRGTPSSPAPGRGGAAPSPSSAPPTAPDDERVQLASMVAQAQNKAPVEDNPYARFATGAAPPPAAPTATQKAPLPPQMQTGDVGQGTAFMTGVEQGLTFGFGDELRGIEAGLGASIPGGVGERLMAAVNIAKQAWGNYQNNPNDAAMAAYKKAVEDARKLYAQSKQQYPGTTLGGEVAGGAAVPLPGGPLTSAGRTVASRVGSGIMQGSIAGGLSGAGSAEGDISQRVGPALIGAGGGAAVGAGVAGAGPTIANYIGRSVMDMAAPAKRAMTKVAQLARQAAHTPPNTRIMPDPVTGQLPANTMIGDILGEPGRVAARAAKNIDPNAGAVLQEPLERRAAGQLQRVVDWLEGKFGPLGDNEMARLAVNAEKAQVTTPMYQGVMQQFSSGVVSPRLVQLLQGHQRLNAAGEKALKEVGDRASVEMRVSPGVDSLEFWDATKKIIDHQITAAKATPGGAGDVQALTQLKNVLVNELDNLTGGQQGPYAQARAASEMYFGVDRAITDGQRFIKSNHYTPEMAANDMRGRSPEAQEAFRKAGLSQLLDKFGGQKDSHNLWAKLNASPDAQKKIAVLFNNDQAAIREFEAMHHVENLMERFREKVRGNSSTMEQYYAAGALTGIGVPASVLTGNYDPTSPQGAAMYGGAAIGARKFANARMAEHLAHMLVSRDPQLIEQATRAAASDVRVMNLLRTMVENAGSRAAGAQVGRSIGD
jgi:hypothetical protein